MICRKNVSLLSWSKYMLDILKVISDHTIWHYIVEVSVLYVLTVQTNDAFLSYSFSLLRDGFLKYIVDHF